MTTVVYGDISPQTTEGKIVASITMIFGIGFISNVDIYPDFIL